MSCKVCKIEMLFFDEYKRGRHMRVIYKCPKCKLQITKKGKLIKNNVGKRF